MLRFSAVYVMTTRKQHTYTRVNCVTFDAVATPGKVSCCYQCCMVTASTSIVCTISHRRACSWRAVHNAVQYNDRTMDSRYQSPPIAGNQYQPRRTPLFHRSLGRYICR